jgi:hypothetical protein
MKIPENTRIYSILRALLILAATDLVLTDMYGVLLLSTPNKVNP